MSFLSFFGKYLPERVVSNSELASRIGCEPGWIQDVSGISERRWATAEQTVADLAVAAGEDCLKNAGVTGAELAMIFVASGTASRRFPGPAAEVAERLGAAGKPALDFPMASAGSLFALALASKLAGNGPILVIGAEKMSAVVDKEPMERETAILFGDGAGAVLVTSGPGQLKVVDSALYSDGSFRDDLTLDASGRFRMNGRSVIMQASRKIPRAISELLERNGSAAGEVAAFLMHQANQNLINKVASTLAVPSEKFFSNIARYGNTSSASMLIAAAEWSAAAAAAPSAGNILVFAAFGAGFHWGALLARGV